jgi:hypothetical protein
MSMDKSTTMMNYYFSHPGRHRGQDKDDGKMCGKPDDNRFFPKQTVKNRLKRPRQELTLSM